MKISDISTFLEEAAISIVKDALESNPLIPFSKVLSNYQN